MRGTENIRGGEARAARRRWRPVSGNAASVSLVSGNAAIGSVESGDCSAHYCKWQQ